MSSVLTSIPAPLDAAPSTQQRVDTMRTCPRCGTKFPEGLICPFCYRTGPEAPGVDDARDIADALSAIERALTEAPVPWKQVKARLKLS